MGGGQNFLGWSKGGGKIFIGSKRGGQNFFLGPRGEARIFFNAFGAITGRGGPKKFLRALREGGQEKLTTTDHG